MNLYKSLARLHQQIPKRRRLQLLLLMLLMVVGACAELATLGAVFPFLTLMADPSRAFEFSTLQQAFARLGWKDSNSILLPATILFCTAAILAAAIRLTLTWATNKVVFSMGYDIGVEVYRRTLYQPYHYHTTKNTSELIAGINKVQLIVSLVILPLLQGTIAVVIATAILAALLVIDYQIASIASIAFGTTYLLVTATMRRRLFTNSHIISNAQTQRVQAAQEGLGGIRDILLDGTQEVYTSRFREIEKKLRDAQATNNLIGTAPRYIVESIGMVAIAFIAYLTTTREGGLQPAIPILGALAIGAQKLMPLLQVAYLGWSKVVGNQSVITDVLKLLEQPIPLEYLAPQNPACKLKFEKKIELKNISFRYQPGSPIVLDRLNLIIPKGSRVGIVGKTGGGKSTAIDIIMSLLEPTSGSIEIDDEKLTRGNRIAWQSSIAHVPQQIFLADSTIAENIAFGIPKNEINISAVKRAAAQSHIAEYIESLADGYDTHVGERGVRLSGGQRQRIGLARALYKNSSLLVLDEATSALDNETEQAVMDCVSRLDHNVTVLMIAHRTSTLHECDFIVTLRSGRIESIAPPEPKSTNTSSTIPYSPTTRSGKIQ